jgi:hypothetical protein
VGRMDVAVQPKRKPSAARASNSQDLWIKKVGVR